MLIDILDKIKNKEITADEANDIYEDLFDKFHNGEIQMDFPKYIGMDRYEWTAFCHGADLATIANWRANGWPNKCTICKKSINYKEFGWFVRRDENSKRVLMHIECMPPFTEKE